ncbi:microsomal signal peptidase 12kDa subunit, partial [Lipomyces oligophaga]|uniref:microsomal signal peptidase 12kDa subunit n=1 Tax=Lipomyces oligophaga TaxID=45792 RepID=UPI0034CFBA19
DLKGQQLAEALTHYLVLISGIVGFFAGYITDDIAVTGYSSAFLFSVGLIVVALPWPFYQRHPLRFLPVSKN